MAMSHNDERVISTLWPQQASCYIGTVERGMRLSDVFRGTDAHYALEAQPDFTLHDSPKSIGLFSEAVVHLSAEAQGGWAAGTSEYDDTGLFRWISCERTSDRHNLIAALPQLAATTHIDNLDPQHRLVRDFAWGCVRGAVSENHLAGVLCTPEGATSIHSRALPEDYKMFMAAPAGQNPHFSRRYSFLLPTGRMAL